MAIMHGWAYGSCRLLGSGHRISSTSQAIFFSAKHRGKYCLVCRIHPWIDPMLMSPQACSIACRRGMWACGWRSCTLHPQAEKKPSIGCINGEYTTLNCSWLVYQFRTKTARWKLTLSQTTTNLGCSDLSCSAAS